MCSSDLLSASAPVIHFEPRGDPLARVTSSAQAVLRTLGAGLEPLFYARALALHLASAGLEFEREGWVELSFRGSSLGRRRIDFVLDALLVELVGGPRLDSQDVHRMRALLAASGKPNGVLLCFASDPLQLRLVKSRGG